MQISDTFRIIRSLNFIPLRLAAAFIHRAFEKCFFLPFFAIVLTRTGERDVQNIYNTFLMLTSNYWIFFSLYLSHSFFMSCLPLIL